MAASLLGTTGNWGIPQDEAGLLIIDISFDFSGNEHPFAYIKCARDVPLACIKRRGKIAFIPLDATPATEDLFLRQL